MNESGPSAGDRAGQATGKVCVHCRRDCSTRPRIKDARGRYHCQECVDQAKARRAAAAAQAPAPEPAPPPPQEQFDVIELDEATAPPTAAAREAASRPCPICGKALPREAAICVECGYNAQTGERLAPAAKGKRAKGPARAAPKCNGCGYSLAGIASGRCPECGKINTGSDWKREQDRAREKRSYRWEYYKPLIMLAVGMAFAALTFSVQGEPEAMFVYLIKYAIEVPIGLAVFWVCCAMFVGFDAPLHLTALRLAGIYAIVDLVAHFTNFFTFIPFYGLILAWIIPFTVYVGLLAEMLEMDISDAAIVAVATFMVKFILAMFVLAYFIG